MCESEVCFLGANNRSEIGHFTSVTSLHTKQISSLAGKRFLYFNVDLAVKAVLVVRFKNAYAKKTKYCVCQLHFRLNIYDRNNEEVFKTLGKMFPFYRRKIQNDENGHCSIEDAKACMELVQLKIENGTVLEFQ